MNPSRTPGFLSIISLPQLGQVGRGEVWEESKQEADPSGKRSRHSALPCLAVQPAGRSALALRAVDLTWTLLLLPVRVRMRICQNWRIGLTERLPDLSRKELLGVSEVTLGAGVSLAS